MKARTEWVAIAGLLLLVGCQATLSTGVQANRDGSGAVSAGLGLDADALRELGDPAKELRLDDLRAAGWEITGPRREDDTLTWVRAAKPFATPGEMSVVAAELSGPEGPFRDFRLTRSRSFLTTTLAFSGLVDLSRGLAGLSDPDLQEKLGDARLALDPDALRDTVRIRVDVRLPGEHQTWEPAMGEQVNLELRSETWNLVPLAPAALALVLLLAAGAVAVGRRRS